MTLAELAAALPDPLPVAAGAWAGVAGGGVFGVAGADAAEPGSGSGRPAAAEVAGGGVAGVADGGVEELVPLPVAADTVEVTADLAEATVPLTEADAVTGEVGGGGGTVVAALADLEKISRITMIPAAMRAACSARRAMQRTLCCAIAAPALPKGAKPKRGLGTARR